MRAPCRCSTRCRTLPREPTKTFSGMSLIKTFARRRRRGQVMVIDVARVPDADAGACPDTRRTHALDGDHGFGRPLSWSWASVVGPSSRVVFRWVISSPSMPTSPISYGRRLPSAGILNVFQRGSAALRRVAEILAEPAEDRTMPPEWENKPLSGEIDFKGLSFSYGGSSSKTAHLKDIDLRVPAGTTLGILGTVGSGKSTLVNMLPRAVAPPRGSVFIDGHDLTEIPPCKAPT